MIKILTLFAGSAVLLLSTASIDKKEAKKVIKTLNENYAFVPSGSISLDSQTTSIQSFIIFKTEVDNLDYQLFLKELKASGDIEKLKIAQIDTSNWSQGKNLMEAYKQYYHCHPAYQNYPVVNISKEGATLYCEWLSAKINKILPEGQGLVFRLPTKAEWLQAARGGLELNTYAWGGPHLRNTKGMILCNFLQLDAENITRDENNEYKIVPTFYFTAPGGLHDDILAPSKSYWPNGFDIYNMNGNAAEILSDKAEVIGGSWRDPGYDVRNESVKAYKGSATNIGFRIVATVNPSKMTWLKVKK
ncbi:MAG: SUMF1/EgtB/PvdO family nonheme iron enzyme [Bacteroidota bacterium]